MKKYLKSGLLHLLSILFLLAGFSLVFLKPMQNRLLQAFQSPERIILATLTTKLNHQDFKILKIKEKQDLYLEIYKRVNQKDVRVSSFQVKSRQNGMMKIQGQTTELFLADLDGDHIDEIIFPALDPRKKPYVYAFKYKPTEDKFYQISTKYLLQNL